MVLSYKVSSLRKPRFVRVPSFEAWPRPGLAEPRSASSAGFGNTAPLLSTEQEGKIVITKTSRYKGPVVVLVFDT